jgi:hypothetical protein
MRARTAQSRMKRGPEFRAGAECRRPRIIGQPQGAGSLRLTHGCARGARPALGLLAPPSGGRRRNSRSRNMRGACRLLRIVLADDHQAVPERDAVLRPRGAERRDFGYRHGYLVRERLTSTRTRRNHQCLPEHRGLRFALKLQERGDRSRTCDVQLGKREGRQRMISEGVDFRSLTSRSFPLAWAI